MDCARSTPLDVQCHRALNAFRSNQLYSAPGRVTKIASPPSDHAFVSLLSDFESLILTMSTSVARRPLVRGATISAVLFCGLYLLSQSRQRVESAATSTPSAVRKVSDYFRFGGGDVPPVKVRNAWLDLETEMQWTKVAGGRCSELTRLTTGIEGYYTFSNMYLSGGALVSVVPSSDALSELPAPRSVLSGSDGKGGRPPPGEELWTQIVGEELAISEFGKRVVRLPGITYLFNDQPGPGEC